MKRFILVLGLLMVGLCSFADSWFNIDGVQHRKFSMEEESTCIFIYNSKYIVCYELPGFQEGFEDTMKGQVRFKYLNEVATGGKDSVKSAFAMINVLKNTGILDVRIWIIPRKGDNKWKLYSGDNRIAF